MVKDNIDTDFYKRSLSEAIQHRLNISDYRRDEIINYIRLASKGPEDIFDVLKEIPLNFVGNEKYFAVYIITLFIANYFENRKKEQDKFIDKISNNNVAKCLGLDLDKLINILDGFGKEPLTKIINADGLIRIINGPFKENEKDFLIFLYYFPILSAFH